MDGIETTGKLRDLGYNGTIVALTANALTGNDKMFAQKSFDGFISKPIDIRHLNAALNKFVRDKYPEEAGKYKPEMAAVQTDETRAKLLKIFCRDAEKAIAVLRNSDIKLFTTTAHAMKSALANIGEAEKSEQAAALEKAGIDGDTGFIAANTEAFIKTLETLIKELSPAQAVAADVTEDTVYLKEQLQIIKTACEDYDDTAAYAALDRLKEKQWKLQTVEALEKIRDALFLHSDFDGAAEQARAIL